MATTTIAKNLTLPRNKGKQHLVPMTAKEAALLALDYFKEMRSLTKAESPTLSIDEVEFIAKNSTWNITVGFNAPNQSFMSLINAPPQRLRQLIKVDALNRKIISMKIR